MGAKVLAWKPGVAQLWLPGLRGGPTGDSASHWLEVGEDQENLHGPINSDCSQVWYAQELGVPQTH